MEKTRVVITGLGLVTPIGTGTETFWNAAVAGINGIRPITSIDVSNHKTKIGGEVLDFNPQDYLSPEKIALMGRSSQFAIAATKLAITDAKLNITDKDNPEWAFLI